MKPLSFFYAGLLFAAVIICGAGWYEGMVLSNAPSGHELKIDTSELRYTEIYEGTDATMANVSGSMQKDISSGVGSIPIIGGTLVQVFSGFQVLKSFILALWDGLKIGTLLITDVLFLLPEEAQPPAELIRLGYIAIVMMFVGSVVYLILGRRT